MSWEDTIRKERLTPKELDESKLPEGHWRKGEGLRKKAKENISEFLSKNNVWDFGAMIVNESFTAEEYKQLLNALISLSDLTQLKPNYGIKPFNKGGLLQILNSMGELE